MVHIAKLASFAAIVSASDILVSLKGVTSKCFGEELANNELLVLKAELQNPAGALMNMFVVSGITEANDIDLRKLEKKNILFQESRKSQIGTAITSLLAGPHWVCLENSDNIASSDVSLSIKYGASAKDYSQIAKLDHLDASDQTLAKILDELKAYHSNMLYMRDKEESMRQTNEFMSSRIIAASVVSLVIVLLAGISQTFYFKRFFKSKKII